MPSPPSLQQVSQHREKDYTEERRVGHCQFDGFKQRSAAVAPLSAQSFIDVDRYTLIIGMGLGYVKASLEASKAGSLGFHFI